jgi:hypothetical protein
MGTSRQPHTAEQRAEIDRLAVRVRTILATLGVEQAMDQA